MSRAPSEGVRWIVAALLLAAAGTAHADWMRDYASGKKAIEAGNWPEAEKLMRAALAEEPEASARKRMQGTRFELYAPAHYAAVAAWRQGDCGRAMQYLQDGSTRAVVAASPALANEAQSLRSACDTRVATTPATTPEPAPAAVPPPSSPAQAPPTVATRPAPAVVAPVEPPKPAPARVEPDRAPPPATTVASTSTKAPAALRSVIQAFVAGNYEAATRVNDAGVSDPKARALLLLVRAAAWHTRADLAGDEALRDRARADIRASKRHARIDPDPNLFSPKIRSLIASTR